MKQIALIAPTASGKTELSIELAQKIDAVILSLDSLSIYKQINIASAKPTIEERKGIKHFGIDEIYPNEKFNVMQFINLYYQTKNYAIKNQKNIIIVGGSSFYLKVLLDGISKVPNITQNNISKAKELIFQNKAWDFLNRIDPNYAKNIKHNDTYRLEKALSLFFQTNTIPSIYFYQNPPIPIINKQDIKIYQIDLNKEILRQRIKLRTSKMINDGLIDEAISLEKQYPRNLPPLKSIGLKESFDYLDGLIDKKQLFQLIVNATNQLAKRQRTFNKNQFKNIFSANAKEILSIIKKL
jgi:tRNA dimethylallyltransferase